MVTIEIEITMKLSKKSIFYEVGISYYGRTIEEEKRYDLLML